MNHTDKAISAVRRIDKRIAELEQQLAIRLFEMRRRALLLRLPKSQGTSRRPSRPARRFSPRTSAR